MIESVYWELLLMAVCLGAGWLIGDTNGFIRGEEFGARNQTRYIDKDPK